MEGARRLNTVEEYYFSQKMREINLLISSGKPILNLGIGNPDLSPPQRVVNALTESLKDTSVHKYQSYQGLPELRSAMAAFYREHYQVHLSPNTEVLPLIGSKEGIMHISMAFLNPGDKVLVPNPGYPTYSAVTKLLEAKPVFYDLKQDNDWLPDLSVLRNSDLNGVKLMWVNYPHMPTGAEADYRYLNELVAFARNNDILLVNDNPYSFILNENPKSILKVNGAKSICLELNSLSKSFNMAGWRVGMVLGSSEHIEKVLKVKSNMDSGMFYSIQKGAIEALNCSRLWYTSLNNVYDDRRKLIWKLAEKLNCTFEENSCGMFVWAKLPVGHGSNEFIENLLKRYHIFIAPGHIFGSNGEGYVRFSLCAPGYEIEEAISRIK